MDCSPPLVNMADDDEPTFETADSGASHTYPQQAGEIRKGSHLMIKGHPCKCIEVSTSKTGKHGHAKAHIVAPLADILDTHTCPFLLRGRNFFLCSFLGLFLILLNLFRITVEEEIRHDLPWVVPGDGSSQTKDLTGQQPPHKTNGLLTLVVTWNGNVHIDHWRVSIGKSNDRDVHIGSFSHWLMIGTWVSHHQQTRLSESSLNLIGKCTRGETSSNWGSSSGRGKLEDSPLSIGPG